jgi:hypothetical protein
LEVVPLAQLSPQQRDMLRSLQSRAASAWWAGGHPGWTVFPLDTEQFCGDAAGAEGGGGGGRPLPHPHAPRLQQAAPLMGSRAVPISAQQPQQPQQQQQQRGVVGSAASSVLQRHTAQPPAGITPELAVGIQQAIQSE